MDEKNVELTMEELMDPIQNSGEKLTLQTDLGAIHEEEDSFPTTNLEGSFPQTESGNEALDEFPSENDAENIEKEPFSQTESAIPHEEEPDSQTTHSESHSPQSGTETEK